MQMTTLGRSGLKVSRLCYGTLTMSPLQRDMSPEAGARLLVYAYERGVRFLDTADLYGTYPHIRLALRDAPDYVISTKAYCYDRQTAREALERAFRGTGRDYIDLFMLHEQESLYTLRGHEEALAYLAEQRERGHIGAVGVSTHFCACVLAATRFPMIDVIHPLINLEGIGIQDGTREDMEAAIRAARERGIGIFAMKPLGGGHLIASNRAALDYAINSPLLDSVAVGMQSEAEIDVNTALFSGAADEAEALEALRARRRRIMVHDWCEGCGRCKARCRQNAIEIVDGRAQIDPEKCVFCGYCARACPQFCIKVV
ncbi:MAG: aldo/keto reductase [Clostridia bacterium]|nr:aldo/keto reductase [Clostridia bacterium]